MNKKVNNDRKIISIQASSIMRQMQEKGEVASKPSMYTGVFPYSLEMIALEKIAPNSFYTMNGEKYLNSIIDVRFDSSYYEYIKEESHKKKKNKRGISIVKCNTKRGKKIMGISQLRTELYRDGFSLDGVHYVEYKRSGSKAKDGNHLFIIDTLPTYNEVVEIVKGEEKGHFEKTDNDLKIYDYMKNYSRLGIRFPEDKDSIVDLTSLKAYEALVGSSIERTIDIKPEEILIVNDIKHTFTATVNMVAMNDKNELISKVVNDYEMTNDCFDGESLADSSLFIKDEWGKQKGFQLLRSNFLKTASFNTKLQEFYADEGVTKVTNMFGKTQDASKIKLVITPNSLKIFKFKQYLKIEGKKPKEITNEDAYYYWLNHIDTTFGVVKSEHISNLGNGLYNVLSYQMINSLPLIKTDLKKILKTDFDYLKDIKNHISVFREHIKHNSICCTGNFFLNMLNINDEFMETKVCKEMRDDAVKNYKERMKTGKIAVRGDYATLCSMPYELLLSTLHQSDFEEFKRTLQPLQQKGEVFCTALEPDQGITIFRSPHICASNVIVGQMKEHKEFTDWFNFSRGIVVVSPWTWDIMERGNSLDFDSDSAILVLDDTIHQRALEVQTKDYATPVLMHKDFADKYGLKPIIPNDVNRHNTPEDLVKLDEILSVNKIGEICNLAQVINSLYWNEYFKEDKANKEYMAKIYEQVNILAILSGIEIDKSKHTFDLNMDAILKDIKNTLNIGLEEVECELQYGQKRMKEIYDQQQICIELQNEINNMSTKEDNYFQKVEELKKENKTLSTLKNKTKIKKRPIRPYFLKFVQDGQYAWDSDMKCPMNFVVELIETTSIRPDKNGSRYDLDVFFDKDDFIITKRNHTTIDKLEEYCLEYISKKKEIDSDWKRDRDKDAERYSDIEYDTLVKLSSLYISHYTMMAFLCKIFAQKEKSRSMKNYKVKIKYEPRYPYLNGNRKAILGILCKAYWETMKGCFKLKAGIRSELCKDTDGKINLWGTKCTEIKVDQREYDV